MRAEFMIEREFIYRINKENLGAVMHECVALDHRGKRRVKSLNLKNHGLSCPYHLQLPVIFTFLWRAKKSNKRNPPGAADSPLNRMGSVARAKTRWIRWYAGIVVSVWFSAAVKCTDFDPLKQFPRVIHGNHPVQGRIAMGSTTPAGGVAWSTVAGTSL